MNNTVYLYVFDTMADWEVGYLTAELNSGRFYKKGLAPSKIVTVGIDKTPVTTMGGLKYCLTSIWMSAALKDRWCYNGTCPDRIAEFTWAYK